MQCRDLDDQIGRYQTTDHAEDRRTDGCEAQYRSVQHNSSPGCQHSEDQDGKAQNLLIDSLLGHETLENIDGNPLTGFLETQEDPEEGGHDREDVQHQA